MHGLLDTLRCQRRERPAAVMLAALGVGQLLAAAVLVPAGLGLLAQLVVGLAVLPLALATALFLLPARLWPDDGEDGDGPGGGGGGRGGPSQPGGPDGGVDWERFEREFAQYAEERRAVRA